MDVEPQVIVKVIDWNSVEGFAARKIRFDVFVDEQKVPPEMELDETDLVAVHVLAVLPDGVPVGTGRLFADSEDAGSGHIGRMAVISAERGRGCGSAILSALLDQACKSGYARAVLSAQVHAIPFYEKHGFEPVGDVYDDAGIPHRMMTREFS